MTSIGESAFESCSGFNGSLTIGSSVTSIGESAFESCSGFTGSLIIPNSVTSIGEYAFRGCSSFNGSLTIGSSVESIGVSAFYLCNFTNIISKAQNAPSLTCSIPCTSKNVYIPKNTTSLYESAWGGYDYTFIEYDREDYHFNGTGSEWNNAANWEESEVPSQSSPVVFINADCQVNTDAVVGAIIVAAGKTLTVNQGFTLTADGITLENGAQLINNGTVSSSNNLTVKKDIAGYGEGTGGWHLVSSPVGTIGIPSSMRAEPEENYDLYRFEQTGDDNGNEWINAKFVESQHINFYLENQRGYLYANKNGTTIVFHGNFATTATKQLQYVEGEGIDFPGFNLVGNPLPCNATIEGTDLRSSNYFYMMNTGGTALEVVANPVLAPCTGVFAVAANSNATVTFSPANVTRGERKALRDIRVELIANGNIIDRAYLNTNGESLPKSTLSDNTSEICFYQAKEKLAVASASATRGEMPLNFKAVKNGTYTLTVNTSNVEAEYLHIIDNLTGEDTDLLAIPTYTFDAKTSDYASRFKLVFGVKDTEPAEVTDTFAFISNGEIIVSNEGRATLQLIDVMGRIIRNYQIEGEARISTEGLTAGVYILTLNGMTQKIVVR